MSAHAEETVPNLATLSHVRSFSPSIASVIQQAGDRSTTFRRLVGPSPEAGLVLAVLAGLEALADLQPRVTLDALWALVDDALAAPADTGLEAPAGCVFVGALGQALGLDFPLLVLPGLVEGAFPAAIRQDPILLDDERRRLPGLPLAEVERGLDRLRFQVAVGSGARRILLTYPRIDAESGMKASTWASPSPLKSRAATPMIVNGCSSTIISRPNTERSPPNARCQ